MKTVNITASASYEVLIGKGLLERAGELVRGVATSAVRAAIVTDDNVAPLYLERVRRQLESAGLETAEYILPNGEASKNGKNFLRLLSFMAGSRLTRSDVLVSLGGGMTGDISGFAAASYMRGIGYVQLPTTLLAAVDSSVGGKTAIDLPEGKNLAGAFCQPRLVLCDIDTLDTLPENIFRDGCAEVIKYAVLGDVELFRHLRERGPGFDREYVISRCVEMKGDYVKNDEFDTGLRRMLNLGHTLGHAIEAESAFAVSHGRAVAIGLACVSRAAARRGICTEACAGEICTLLERFGLPVRTEYDIESLGRHMSSDKKHRGKSISVIVPERIGRCRTENMTDESLVNFMKEGL